MAKKRLLDKDAVQKNIKSITIALENLKRHCPVDHQTLLKNKDELWIIERGLQILIQNILDLGGRVLASEFKNHWDDYIQLIDKLGGHGLIDVTVSNNLRIMADLRNMILYEYTEVDLGKITFFCNTKLLNIEYFVQQLFLFLNKICSNYEKESSQQ